MNVGKFEINLPTALVVVSAIASITLIFLFAPDNVRDPLVATAGGLGTVITSLLAPLLRNMTVPRQPDLRLLERDDE